MSKIWADHKKEMTELDKGAKPSADMIALIEKVARLAAKGFED